MRLKLKVENLKTTFLDFGVFMINAQNKGPAILQILGNAVVGFSSESISYVLGGKYRSSYRLLNDNIINGRIFGIAVIPGCTATKLSRSAANVILTKKLIKNNVLVLAKGNAATAGCDAGLADPRRTAEFAGAGLAEVCEAVGIPPMLHCGSELDNSELLTVLTQIVSEGGLGEDIPEIPAAVACLEPVTEKALSACRCFIESGLMMVCGSETKPLLGIKLVMESDPLKAADLILTHIEKKRDALGINKKSDRKLFDMADRRTLTVK
jgi:anaerobic carbon-monoxide dehydrogenase catalytic subunit